MKRPHLKDYHLKPYQYILDLEKYIDYLKKIDYLEKEMATDDIMISTSNRAGKRYAILNNLIEKIKQGEEHILIGPDYVVMSKKHYKDIIKNTKEEIASVLDKMENVKKEIEEVKEFEIKLKEHLK